MKTRRITGAAVAVFAALGLGACGTTSAAHVVSGTVAPTVPSAASGGAGTSGSDLNPQTVASMDTDLANLQTLLTQLDTDSAAAKQDN